MTGCARRKKRQPIPSGSAGTAPRRRAFGLVFRVVLVVFFVACAWLRRLSAKREGLWCGDSRTTMHKSRTCLCQAHAMVPKSKNRLTVSTISYQITKSLDIKNVLSNFPYPTIALCGLRPRHFDLAFMRNYIALKHVFDMHPKSWADFWGAYQPFYGFSWVPLGGERGIRLSAIADRVRRRRNRVQLGYAFGISEFRRPRSPPPI